jgi:hypothetical protein
MNAAWRVLRLLAIWLAAVLTASLVGLVIARRVLPQDLLRQCNDSVGNYLQALGTIYAVLLAFVVFVVWTQFNDLRSLVEREANDVADLFRTTQGLPEPHRSSLRAHLRRYVDGVLEREWPAMTRHDPAALEHVGCRLEEAWETLRAFEPVSERDAALFGEALGRFNELYDVRTQRLTTACLRVPLPLKLLVYTGAIMTIGSMYLMSVDSFFIHAIMTMAMAGVVTHILYIVYDLDDAFSGGWQIARTPFERVRDAMADEPK